MDSIVVKSVENQLRMHTSAGLLEIRHPAYWWEFVMTN